MIAFQIWSMLPKRAVCGDDGVPHAYGSTDGTQLGSVGLAWSWARKPRVVLPDACQQPAQLWVRPYVCLEGRLLAHIGRHKDGQNGGRGGGRRGFVHHGRADRPRDGLAEDGRLPNCKSTHTCIKAKCTGGECVKTQLADGRSCRTTKGGPGKCASGTCTGAWVGLPPRGSHAWQRALGAAVLASKLESRALWRPDRTRSAEGAGRGCACVALPPK